MDNFSTVPLLHRNKHRSRPLEISAGLGGDKLHNPGQFQRDSTVLGESQRNRTARHGNLICRLVTTQRLVIAFKIDGNEGATGGSCTRLLATNNMQYVLHFIFCTVADADPHTRHRVVAALD
jgi:hypothetical protein